MVFGLSVHSQESVDTGEMAVGTGGNSGFDCLAVIANGAIVTESGEVDVVAHVHPSPIRIYFLPTRLFFSNAFPVRVFSTHSSMQLINS